MGLTKRSVKHIVTTALSFTNVFAKWMLSQKDGGWLIQNLGTGRYLSYVDSPNLRDGLTLVGSERAQKWDIRAEINRADQFRYSPIYSTY
jgi:hypothetical protein